MKYSILTFGCRVNQADSFDIEAALRAQHLVASEPEEADLVVVNTCTVTAAADQGARHAIRRVQRVNPRARILVTGCYATRSPESLENLPGVIRLVPNTAKERLPAILASEVLRSTAGKDAVDEMLGPCGSRLSPGALGRTAATLRIQTGCDESCSYCIIPSTRGRGRSRVADEVLAELAALTRAGYAEVVVTGVHLGSYGRDLVPQSSLAAILQDLGRHAEHEGGPLLRVSSIEPMDCTDAVVDAVAGSAMYARHLHLPLQHGSDAVLSAMRRPYTIADYQRVLATVRSRMPDAAVGSDVMVGFPGESDADFEAMEAFLAASSLTHLHVFPYSERPGTDAASFAGKVPQAVAASRAERLRRLSRTLHDRFLASQAGSVRPGLVLRSGTRVMTDNYLTVSLATPRPRNERVRVRILSTHPLSGEVVR